MGNYSFDIENFGDEIMAIRIEDGAYYAIKSGNAFLVFNYLYQNGSSEKLINSLSQQEELKEQTKLFISFLKEEGFCFQEDQGNELVPPKLDLNGFSYKKFDDMGDLIKLDPIHDVSELGWPEKKSL